MSSLTRMPVGVAVLAAALAPLPMAEARAPVETLRGTCELALTVTHNPPLTATPATGAARARGDGRCSGELLDESGGSRTLDGAPATLRASGRGTLSCGGGQAAGEGVLAVGGARIRFTFQEARGPGTATLRYEGSAGGSATAVAHVSADQDPAESVSACADDGLRRVGVSLRLLSADLAG